MAIPSHFHTQLSSEVGIRGPAKPEMLISWSFTEILSTPFVTVNLIILLFYSMPNNGPYYPKIKVRRTSGKSDQLLPEHPILLV